jgi:ABC-type branched-subunit amino acid transport system permease subunit
MVCKYTIHYYLGYAWPPPNIHRAAAVVVVVAAAAVVAVVVSLTLRSVTSVTVAVVCLMLVYAVRLAVVDKCSMMAVGLRAFHSTEEVAWPHLINQTA